MHARGHIFPVLNARGRMLPVLSARACARFPVLNARADTGFLYLMHALTVNLGHGLARFGPRELPTTEWPEISH
jgi:hypothetical protein